MKFIIDNKMFERFQGLNIGVLIARDLNNKGSVKEIEDEIRKQEEEISSKIAAVPKFEREFRVIQRQQQIKETLYFRR